MKKTPPKNGIFPFSIQIFTKEGTPPIMGFIVKIADIGFLFRSDHMFILGSSIRCQFDLPRTQYSINEMVKIIKNYDTIDILPSGEKEKAHMSECHFINIQPEKKKELIQFLDQFKLRK